MSKSLYYEPIIKPKYKCLGDKLQDILAEKYKLYDGATVLRMSDITYLDGLNDAGVETTDELIAQIKKHGEVRIYLQ